MRRFSALLVVVLLGFGGHAFGQAACTGLCLQQVTCPNNGTTSIKGIVYAPNGTDPLPNVTVYIPNAPVAAFTPGVSCDVVGAAPSGSPLVGQITSVDGSFTLNNVPVGSNIPIVIQSGRWRRQLTVPSTTACTQTALPSTAISSSNTTLPFATMPQDQTQGDIPKIAIATGAVDSVECVLRKVGIKDSEFTDPTGSGRINLYSGSGGAGAIVSSSTPTQASLMENASILNSYDVLMLPCQGTPNNNVVAGTLGTQELANFINFANIGGRVYSSHFSYAWMYQNSPFNGVANWAVNQSAPPDGIATVDTSFTGGQTLSTWLQEVGASTTQGQISISTLKHDFNGVIAPTQSWLALNNSTYNNPVMQFVFDTPIAPTGTVINQCGRVLYNEYHVEATTNAGGKIFPSECSSAAMTPQEKLLEYSLFELTSEGGQPSLAPLSQDFGNEAYGFTTAAQTFTWTNNSSFASQVTSATTTGDYSITANTCGAVAAGTSCKISVVFTPTALGARAGSLTVVSSGNTLTASLTGTGVPGFSLSAASLDFGNLDVGATASQTLTLTSNAPQALSVPTFVTTGSFTVNTKACGTTLAAAASCVITITFLPTTTGPLTGTVGVNSSSLLYSGLSATLTGNGVDFAISLNPTSGKVIAGNSVTTTATLTPIAGFSAPLTVSCTLTGATASACNLASTSVTPTAAVSTAITINTTSQYTVIGYGVGGRGYWWLIIVANGFMLWYQRKRAGSILRASLLLTLLAVTSFSMTGCSGKLPTQNSSYTGPGTYTLTISATDGFLIHTATYSLTVSAK